MRGMASGYVFGLRQTLVDCRAVRQRNGPEGFGMESECGDPWIVLLNQLNEWTKVGWPRGKQQREVPGVDRIRNKSPVLFLISSQSTRSPNPSTLGDGRRLSLGTPVPVDPGAHRGDRKEEGKGKEKSEMSLGWIRWPGCKTSRAGSNNQASF